MRIIYSKMIGFVRFVLRASAEFAKEALADQDIGNGEVLNVRDLVAHYWHSSMYSVVVPCCSRASPTTGIAIGPRTASSFSPCCILLFASFCCCDTRQVRWAHDDPNPTAKIAAELRLKQKAAKAMLEQCKKQGVPGYYYQEHGA